MASRAQQDLRDYDHELWKLVRRHEITARAGKPTSDIADSILVYIELEQIELPGYLLEEASNRTGIPEIRLTLSHKRFDRYDRFESLWRPGIVQTEAMKLCGNAPCYLYNTKTGDSFIGTYKCGARLCRECGAMGRNRIGRILWHALRKEYSQSNMVYHDYFPAQDWNRRYQKLREVGANYYKVIREGYEGGRGRIPLAEQRVHIFANKDFSTRSYGDNEPINCERLEDEAELEDQLQHALGMPPRVIVWPGGKYPKVGKPPSDWKQATGGENLTQEEIEEIQEDEEAQVADRLTATERVACAERIAARIEEKAKLKRAAEAES